MKKNDPHVASLTYRVVAEASIRFDNPLPLEKEYGAYTLRLSEEVLSVLMKEHHATEESARACVEPYLRAWEIKSGLQRNRPTMTFQFASSEIIDRNPSPRGGHLLTVECGGYVVCGGEVTFTIGVGKYPEPPSGFLATDDVKVMWTRYRAYLEGREPLLSMAYACLSLLEGTTGQKKGARAAVCAKYNINQSVRDKLGDLVSEKGCPEEARKLDHEATKTPLTGAEKDWIERVIRAFIQRKAEYDADPTKTFAQITLADFPTI